MSPHGALLFLFAVLAALVLLPLLPAVREVLRPRDDKPLRAASVPTQDTAHFARTFRRFLQDAVAEAMVRAREGETVDATLPDGKPCRCLPALTTLTSGELSDPAVLAAAGDLTLPEHSNLPHEVYADGRVTVGSGSNLRAVLAEGDIELAAGCHSARWLHAEGTLRASRDCDLCGRASAGTALILATSCRFERLQAPAIHFGHPNGRPTPTVVDSIQRRRVEPRDLPHLVDDRAGRALVEGDLDLPANSDFSGDIVVTGNLRIGAGSRIDGRLKSHGDVQVESKCRLDGAVTAGRNLVLGEDVQVSGPVIAERHIHLGSGSRVGEPGMPTTITAETIDADSGAVAHGIVWGRGA